MLWNAASPLGATALTYVNWCNSTECDMCQEAMCFTGLDDHFLFYYDCMNKTMGISQIDLQIIITKPCCHIEQVHFLHIAKQIAFPTTISYQSITTHNPVSCQTLWSGQVPIFTDKKTRYCKPCLCIRHKTELFDLTPPHTNSCI